MMPKLNDNGYEGNCILGLERDICTYVWEVKRVDKTAIASHKNEDISNKLLRNTYIS